MGKEALDRWGLVVDHSEWADERASSHDLLQEICMNAFQFGVKEEDVEKFYECVWLERVDDFGELLKLCSKSTIV